MKKILFAAMAAMMVFASCVNEGGNVTEVSGDKAVIKIAVKGNAGTRALDPIGAESNGYQADAKVAVNDATVFIISDGGAILGAPVYLNSSSLTSYVEKETTTAAKRVVVIGNLGADLTASGELFHGLATEADLNGVFDDFKNMDGDHKWLTGVSADIDWDAATIISGGSNDGQKLVSKDVELMPISSRIDVLIDIENFTNFKDANAKTKFTGVSVLYSGINTYFAGTNLVPAEGSDPTEIYYYSGHDWDVANTLSKSNTTFLTSGTDANFNMLNKAWTANYTASPAPGTLNFEESFYAFPGKNAHSKNTIVTVYGWFDTNSNGIEDAGEARFWPVHFSTDDVPGAQLGNGKVYNMTLKFTGDADVDTGTTDPEIILKKGFLTIDISSKGWEVVTPFEKVFN